MTCVRCAGRMATRWDAELQVTETFCLNCGHQPQYARKYEDGRSADEPLLCRICKIRPRSVWASSNRHYSTYELERCTECRIKHVVRRRTMVARKDRKSLGNLKVRQVL